MNWLDKLERKIGRYAIPNLTVYLLAGYVIGYAVAMLMPNMLGWLTLEPALILRGQVWRLISWVLIPPSGNLVSLFFLVLLYYSLGILIYGYEVSLSTVGLISTNYITMSIFLAFAAIYPDMEVLLFFILPVKMKWMALVYAVMALYYFVQGGMATRVAIAASLLNFIIFFLSSRNMRRFGPREQARKARFRRQSRPHMTYTNGAKHRCAVCGRTELDDPNLEFRFCSKCRGNYEYCQDHLFTHEHVK